jgi:predicted  nucleic acid-binding Zn-ribbon protein
MPWTVPITAEDGTTYPLHFDGASEPTPDEINYAADQVLASHEGQPSVFGSFARSAARNVAPTVLGGRIGAPLGSMAGEALGTALAGSAAGSEFPVVGNIIGGLVGAGIGMYGFSKAQQAAANAIDPSASNPFSSASEEADVAANPNATLLGGLAAAGRPSLSTLQNALKSTATVEGRNLLRQGYDIAKRVMTDPSKAESIIAENPAAYQAFADASNVGGNVGIGAVQGGIQGQSPTEIAKGVLGGALFNQGWMHGKPNSPEGAKSAEAKPAEEPVVGPDVQKAVAATDLADGAAQSLDQLSGGTSPTAAELRHQTESHDNQVEQQIVAPETPTPEENAPLPESSAGKILQREQEQTGEAGSGRERVEPEQQGNEVAQETLPEQEPPIPATEAPETPVEVPETSKAEELPPEPQNAAESTAEGEKAPPAEQPETPETFGSKNASTEEQRKALGLPEIVKDAPEGVKESFDKTKAQLEADPEAGDKLVQSIEESGDYKLSPDQQGLLTHETVRIHNGLRETERVMEDAASTPEAKAAAEVQHAAWIDRLNRLHNVNAKAGKAWGQWGVWRQQMLNREYGLEQVLKRYKRASGGADISKEDYAKLSKLVKEHEDLLKKHQELVESQKKTSKKSLDKVVSDLKKSTDKLTKRATKEEIIAKIKDSLKPKTIKASIPEGELQSRQITEAHQNQAVAELKKTEIGRRILRDAIIAKDWQTVINHPAFKDRNFTSQDLATISKAEGFYDPETGRSVVMRNGIHLKEGETPQQAVKRVLLHERVGHDGLTALRKLDPKFDREWHAIVSQIPEEELQAIAKTYKDADRSQLIDEWFSKNFEKLNPDEIPDRKTVFGKLYQAIRDFLHRYFGSETHLDQRVRDLMGHVLRSDEAMEPRRGFGDVVASLPEEEKADLSKIPHSVLHDIAKFHVQEAIDKGEDIGGEELSKRMQGTLSEGGVEATPEQVQEAYSKYGEYKEPTEEEVTKKAAEARREMLLLSQLRDAKAGNTPFLTGEGRHKSTAEARELDKQVRDTIRKNKLSRGEDQKRRASPLDAKQARIENEIGDVERQLKILREGGDIAKRERQDVGTTPKIDDLQKRLDGLKKEKAEILKEREQPAPEPGDSLQKIGNQLDATNERIKTLEDKLAKGDLSVAKPKEQPTAPILEEARAKLKGLNEKMAKARSEAERPERERLAAEKELKDIRERIADKEAKLAKGDLSKDPVKHRAISAELQAERAKLKDVNERIAKARSEAERPERERQKAQDALDDAEAKVIQLEEKLRVGDLSKTTKVSKPVSPELAAAREQVKGLQKALEKARSEADRPRREAEAAAKELQAAKDHVADLEKKLATGDLSKEEKTPRSIPDELKAEREKAAELTKELNRRRDELESQTPITEEEYNKEIERRLKSKRETLNELERKLKEEDFEKKPKKQPIVTPETEKLDVEIGRKRQDIENAIFKKAQANRTGSQKFWDNVVRGKRAFILSSVNVFGKLAAAAQTRALSTVAEEALNHGWHAVLPEKFTSKLKTESNPNITSYAKQWAKAYMRAIDDAKTILKTGQSDLDVLYGKYKGQREEGLDSFFGRTHAIMKAPTKRAAFEHAMEKLFAWEAQHNPDFDPSDPTTKLKLGVLAYKEAQRAIFMQDNALTKAFQGGLSILEKQGGAGPGIARTMRVLFPIVKVPTNMVGEAIQYGTGLPVGLVKLAKVWHKGFETLKPEDADLIMRQLKKGSLGSALMALGFLASSAVGGYYQEHEKRKLGEPKAGGIKVAGIDVPSWLMHSPAFEAIQMGSTLRRVAESHTASGEERGLPAGALASLFGVVSETPFVNEMTRVGNLESAEGRERYLGDLAKAQVEPQLLQQVAAATDSGPARKPETFAQDLEMGIPGLRQNVPIKVNSPLPPSDKGEVPKTIADYSTKGGVMPSAPSHSELLKKNPKLSQQQWEKYAEERGKYVKSMLLADIPHLKTMSEHDQHTAIAAISHDATKRAKDKLGLQ